MEQRPKGEEEPTAQGYGRETEAGSAVTGSPRRVQSRYMLSNPSKPVFFRNEEQDQVTKSFSNTAMVGIRSLPNALKPNFRQTLLKQVMPTTTKHSATESGTGTGGCAAAPVDAPSVAVPGARGQRRPGFQASSGLNVFSYYEYYPSEYSAEVARRDQSVARRESKDKWVTDADFAVRAPPAIPKSTGAFNEFTYVLDPFESREEYEKEQQRTAAARTHVMQGPMKAGGRVQRNEQLKAQVVECMRRLSKALAADWPKAFLRTFEDKQGLLVTAFDRQRMCDGDITSYMNQLFRTHEVVSDFKLRRDSTRWGVMERTVPTVYYVFVPPWVHARIVHPLLSQVPDNKPVPGIREPPMCSSRVPFEAVTEGGLPLKNAYVQTYPTSFKT